GIRDRTVTGVQTCALPILNDVALDAASELYPKAKRFNDFRKIFDDPSGFDAVVVSTAEQTHAFATYLALTHGKHVYCEKPLTYKIGRASCRERVKIYDPGG